MSMKRSIELRMAAVAVVFVFAFAMSGLAQQSKSKMAPEAGLKSPIEVSGSPQSVPPHVPSTPGTLIIPQSSQKQPVPAGHNFAAHTNFEIFVPNGVKPDEAPPFTNLGFETPASIACHYGLVSPGSGIAPNCNPQLTTVDPTGGSNTIAIVDAYDDPDAPSDLAYFSDWFGIPFKVSQLQVVWANTVNSSCPVNYGYGVPIDESGDWEFEEALDVEWAHAMAPSANIYLVEACSTSDIDLAQAVLVANNLVNCGQSLLNSSTGVLGTCTSSNAGMVTMSWGGGEYAGETAYDSYFTAPNVVYLAAAGDSPGVDYPCASPNVVCVGGTTLRRNASNFNFEQETAWVFTGTGVSYYEPKPSYQTPVGNNPTAWRGVPDVSMDADPYTGVYVYDTFPVEGIEYYEWLIVGGTSLSTQALAGIVNTAGSFALSSSAEITNIYTNRTNTAAITDITYGYCGYYMGLPTLLHWDYCTGVGVPNGYTGK
jgi:subtilase family serine protease